MKNIRDSKFSKKNLNPVVIIICVVLVLYAITLLFPLISGFIMSLRSTNDWDDPARKIFDFPDMSYWKQYAALYKKNPEGATKAFGTKYYNNIFGNYFKAFPSDGIKMGKSFYMGWNLDVKVGGSEVHKLPEFVMNSLLYSVGLAFLQSLASAIVAYLTSTYKYKFSNFLYAFNIFVMVMPIVGNAGTMITLLRRLSMFDSIWGFYVRGFSYPSMYYLIFFGFFQGMSGTYYEAADIDGASQFRIMFQICMPLSITMISTCTLIQFVAFWNDYNTPLLYLPNHPTLAYAVYYQTTKVKTSVEKIATSMLLAIPMIIIFITLKDKLMGNISLGGIKE